MSAIDLSIELTALPEEALWLAGGWKSLDELKEAKQHLLALENTLVAWVNSKDDKHTLFIKFPTAASRLRFRLQAQKYLQLHHEGVWHKDGRTKDAAQALRNAHHLVQLLRDNAKEDCKDDVYRVTTRDTAVVVQKGMDTLRLARFNQHQERWNWPMVLK
eukprot:1465129-Amphidinium_carterae.1